MDQDADCRVAPSLIPLFAIWALFALIQETIAAPIFPQLTGRIVDEANLLTATGAGIGAKVDG